MTTLLSDRAQPSTAHRRLPITGVVLRRAALVTAVMIVLVADVHLIGPYAGQAADVLIDPAWSWVAVAVASEVVSIVATALLQRQMLSATGMRVPMLTAVRQAYAAYAMSMSLPAGPAFSLSYLFRCYRRMGATAPAAAFTVVSSGVLSTLAYGLLAVVGLTVAGGTSGGPATVGIGLAAGVVVLILLRWLLRRPDLAERLSLRALRAINRLRRREADAGAPELRRSTRMLNSIHPRRRDWAVGMTAALANWIADLTCLFASCRAVGIDSATIGVVLLAYLSGTSVLGVSLVPGGIGLVEAALVVVLVSGGVQTATAAAAVILYRVLSLGFGVVVGWAAWIRLTVAMRRATGAAKAAHPPPGSPRRTSVATSLTQETP